jgi:tol-pal system protein YbgF
MVNIGRKTEEYAPVLIKKNVLKNIGGAQKVILCLSFTACLLFGFSPKAVAQSPVYNTDSYNGGNAAQTEIRLQQMETQIRELTGRVEKQIFEINGLKAKINLMEKAGVNAPVPTAPLASSLPNPSVMQNDLVPYRGSEFATPRAATTPVINTTVPRSPDVGTVTVTNSSTAATISPSVRPPTTTESLNAAVNNASQNLNLNLNTNMPAGIQTTTLTGGDAAAQYEAAFANLKSNKYDVAQKGFENFLVDYKDHVLAANAHYWLGETFYVRGQYDTASRRFASGFQAFPESAKSPDMLLKLGMSLKRMDKNAEACVALTQVPVKFPAGAKTILALAEKEKQGLDCKS